MSVTTVSSSMITDATILNADIGAAAAIATTKLGAGAIVQVVNTLNVASTTGTTLLPQDDTIPQSSEGTEFMTLAITPTNTNNILIVDVVAYMSSTAVGYMSVGLFQDSTANALSATATGLFAANSTATVPLQYKMTAGTTSSTTFKVRLGANLSGTVRINGRDGARVFGGVGSSSITITEIQV